MDEADRRAGGEFAPQGRPAAARLRVAVDVGGTFTDVVIHDPQRQSLRFDKVSTTPLDPAEGVARCFQATGLELSKTEHFAHGTTLGLNALLTRSGVPTAIVTTLGFRDVYLLGRTDRTVAYDFKYRKPPSLVPRQRIYEVQERLNFRGETLIPLDGPAADQVAEQIAQSGVRSVAVCFLHSYANPSHELAMEQALLGRSPSLSVTLSHRLTREYREYERTSTTVLDAYTKPLVADYLGRLQRRLRELRFQGRFFMIRSGGGAMSVERAAQRPVDLILSGPAGGVLGAAAFARQTGNPNLITMDMGGTSLDASLIVSGEPTVHHEAAFQGLPILSSTFQIETIGAGGGSVIWTDPAQHLQVGPGSAGADPGPACYGRGGTEPTLTDCALICGYLGSDGELAGGLTLDRDLAREALGPSGKALGLSIEETAFGALRIAITKTVGAVRAVTVEQGHQPSDFALLTFGGAGGLIAAKVARELDITTVIVPPGPGSFSALGMLSADVQQDFARTLVVRLEPEAAAGIAAAMAELEEEGDRALEEDGFAPARRQFRRFLQLRYQGQEHSLAVPLPLPGPLDASRMSGLAADFHEAHRKRFGHALSDPVEVVTLRCSAVGRVDLPELPRLAPRSRDTPPEATGVRPVYAGETLPYSLYQREEFQLQDQVRGPAIIGELTATTVLDLGDWATVGPHGELVIRVAGAAGGL